MFLIKVIALFGVLFFIEKLGPGGEGSDHTLYYSLSQTLLVTLIVCYYLISTNFRAGPGSHIKASKGVSLSLQRSDISTISDYLNIDGENGLNLTSGTYVTYIFSVLIISLMIIERIDSKVKWDFKDFTVPIPIIGDLICGTTMHNIIQTINIILFTYVTLYIYYQIDLLNTDKKCTYPLVPSPCMSPEKAKEKIPSEQCSSGSLTFCTKPPFLKCEVVDEETIKGVSKNNKILLSHDLNGKVDISPNNKVKISEDCKKDINDKILSKLKYTNK